MKSSIVDRASTPNNDNLSQITLISELNIICRRAEPSSRAERAVNMK
jgi:hypothetical protein